MEKTQSRAFIDRLADAVAELGWDLTNDDVEINIGGKKVSCLQNDEGANKKWHPPFGHTVYNSDAFITLKRNPKD